MGGEELLGAVSGDFSGKGRDEVAQGCQRLRAGKVEAPTGNGNPGSGPLQGAGDRLSVPCRSERVGGHGEPTVHRKEALDEVPNYPIKGPGRLQPRSHRRQQPHEVYGPGDHALP